MEQRKTNTSKVVDSPEFKAKLQDSEITAAAIAARRRRGKRTQAERSSEMRVRVMTATLECLSQFGYAGTTFGTISKLAGVSRGALQHHYPEKNFLIAGALEMFGDRFERPFVRQIKKMPAGRKRMAYVLDTLWEASTTPPVTAVVDVRIAARTDPQLQAMLLALEHRIRDRQYAVLAEALGGGLGQSPDFPRRVEAVIATMRGLSIPLGYGWDKSEINAAWEVARDDFIAGFERSAPKPG